MSLIDYTNRVLQLAGDVVAGEDTGWIEVPQDPTRKVHVGWFPDPTGGNMTVEYTMCPVAAVRADLATVCTLATSDTDDGVQSLEPCLATAVRFSAGVKDGSYRVNC